MCIGNDYSVCLVIEKARPATSFVPWRVACSRQCGRKILIRLHAIAFQYGEPRQRTQKVGRIFTRYFDDNSYYLAIAYESTSYYRRYSSAPDSGSNSSTFLARRCAKLTSLNKLTYKLRRALAMSRYFMAFGDATIESGHHNRLCLTK